MSDETTKGSSSEATLPEHLLSANWEEQLREARARREKVLANKRPSDLTARPKPWESLPSLPDDAGPQIDESELKRGAAKPRRKTPIAKAKLSGAALAAKAKPVSTAPVAKPEAPTKLPPSSPHAPLDPPRAQRAPLPPLVPASEPLIEAASTVPPSQTAAAQPERKSRMGLIAACMFGVGTALGAGVAWQFAQPTPAGVADGSTAPAVQAVIARTETAPSTAAAPGIAETADGATDLAAAPELQTPSADPGAATQVAGAGPSAMETLETQLPPYGTSDETPALFALQDGGTDASRYAPFRLAALAPDIGLALPEAAEFGLQQGAPRMAALTSPLTAPEVPANRTVPLIERAPIQLAAAATDRVIGSRSPAPTVSVAAAPNVAQAPEAGTSGGIALSFAGPSRPGAPTLAGAPDADPALDAPHSTALVALWAGMTDPTSPAIAAQGGISAAAPATRASSVSPRAPRAPQLADGETTLPAMLEYARIAVLDRVPGLSGLTEAPDGTVITASLPPAPRALPVAVRPGSLPDTTVAALAPLPRPVIKPTFETVTVRVHAPSTVEDDKLEALTAQVGDSGVGGVQLKRVNLKITRDNIRYYHAEDAEAAAAVGEATGALVRDFTTFSPSPPIGSIEYWVAGSSQGGTAAVATRTPKQATPTRTKTRRTPTVARSGPSAEERRLRAVQQRIIQRLRQGSSF